MGASVLHEDAIFPVRKAGIPINIRNTNAPEDKGTLIVEGACPSAEIYDHRDCRNRWICVDHRESDDEFRDRILPESASGI